MTIKQTLRRLLEGFYLYAWGNEGSPDLRDEFHTLRAQCNVGHMMYNGKTFEWVDDK